MSCFHSPSSGPRSSHLVNLLVKNFAAADWCYHQRHLADSELVAVVQAAWRLSVHSAGPLHLPVVVVVVVVVVVAVAARHCHPFHPSGPYNLV